MRNTRIRERDGNSREYFFSSLSIQLSNPRSLACDIMYFHTLSKL